MVRVAKRLQPGRDGQLVLDARLAEQPSKRGRVFAPGRSQEQSFCAYEHGLISQTLTGDLCGRAVSHVSQPYVTACLRLCWGDQNRVAGNPSPSRSVVYLRGAPL